MDTSEKRFEQDIETYFLNHGYKKVEPSSYDKEKMLFPSVLEEFVSTTQPKAWARYTKLYGASAVDKLTRRVNTAISEYESRPTVSTSYLLPSVNFTLTLLPSSITWAFVKIYPNSFSKYGSIYSKEMMEGVYA